MFLSFTGCDGLSIANHPSADPIRRFVTSALTHIGWPLPITVSFPSRMTRLLFAGETRLTKTKNDF
jgi:hypothetical protein